MSSLDAIVVPTRSAELPLILRNMTLWSYPEFTPSLQISDSKPDLIFLFNNDEATTHEKDITYTYNKYNLCRFFNNIRFIYLSLRGLDDLYSRDERGPVGPQGYKAGPNNQFFKGMEALSHLGGAIFYMETDCIPIRPGWLDAAQKTLADHHNALVIGAIYRGRTNLSQSLQRHINGNAIYNIGNPEFQDFVNQWKHWNTALVKNGCSGLAYDTTIETVFSMASEDNDSRFFLINYAGRLHYTDLIYNISSADDCYDVNPLIVKFTRQNAPNTHFMHGALFAKAVERLLMENDTIHPDSMIVDTRPAPKTLITRSFLTKSKWRIAGYLRKSADWLVRNNVKRSLIKPFLNK